MASPRLMFFAERARTQGSIRRHMPESSPPFLLGPDEVCVEYRPRKRRWKFKALCIAALLLGAGVAFGAPVALFIQVALGK